jgi:hypothetical protein
MRGLLLAVALAALVVGCGAESETTAPPPPPTAAAEPTGREPAPAISGTTLEGDAVSLDDYHGRPVFVNVWSSW